MAHGPIIDHEICIRCNQCVDACPLDVISFPDTPGDPPVPRYPDECWYCGSCYMVCPTEPKAVKPVHPPELRLFVRQVK